MKGRFFLDTNVFVYTFDSSAPKKQTRARKLVAQALEGRRGVISFQVVQEFLNVATRKFATPLTMRDCVTYLESVLSPLYDVSPSMELYREALDIRERWQLSYYDALIVTAALSAGCERLLSENLQHGLEIRGLTIENPFRNGPAGSSPIADSVK
jgi:predicted nucleic acid-binding protein